MQTRAYGPSGASASADEDGEGEDFATGGRVGRGAMVAIGVVRAHTRRALTSGRRGSKPPEGGAKAASESVSIGKLVRASVDDDPSARAWLPVGLRARAGSSDRKECGKPLAN